MKKLSKTLIASALLLAAHSTQMCAQYYTKYFADESLKKEAKQWVESGQWRNGFTAASPHNMVNLVEFYQQYQRNPEQWKALFTWLATNDLLAVPGGRTPIPGTTLTVSVEDSRNEPLEKRSTESHFHHIDFMYVVKGVERFGLLDHYTSRQSTKYKPDVIRYSYDVKRTKFVDSATDKFLIMFPNDWHIAKVATDLEDQNIRVLVIKVDYKD